MYIQRNIVLLMTLFMGMLSVIAQNTNSVSGRVIDKQSKEAMEKSTLQLYQVTTARNGVKDTTFISGTFSNDMGYFTFNSVKKGNYLLKVSYLGYQELYQSLTKASGVPLSLGDIALEPDAIQIDEAVVTANVPKMVIKDDTVFLSIFERLCFNKVSKGLDYRLVVEPPWFHYKKLSCPRNDKTTVSDVVFAGF